MSPELDKALCEKYPKIFADRYASGKLTAMYWGLEVGDGWYNIIDSLCQVIQHEVDFSLARSEAINKHNLAVRAAKSGNKKAFEQYWGSLDSAFNRGIYQDMVDGIELEKDEVEMMPQVKALQVKEKFGVLRFYVDSYSDVISAAIKMAELMSSKTCETCGSPGRLIKGGWLYVACDKHTRT